MLQSRSGTIRYEMVGVTPTLDAGDYFVISPNSGLITIAQSLATDTAGPGPGKRPMYRVSATFIKCFLTRKLAASMARVAEPVDLFKAIVLGWGDVT